MSAVSPLRVYVDEATGLCRQAMERVQVGALDRTEATRLMGQVLTELDERIPALEFHRDELARVVDWCVRTGQGAGSLADHQAEIAQVSEDLDAMERLARQIRAAVAYLSSR